jgi:hypothetical protein
MVAARAHCVFPDLPQLSAVRVSCLCVKERAKV